MIDKYLELAKQAAIEAGVLLSKRQNIFVDENHAHDIKLSSDKDSECLIIDYLNSSGYSILSEERGLTGNTSGLHWIIDPLDGTVNYYNGLDDLCCVSIALYDGAEPIFGIINRFMSNEIFVGVAGDGAYLNNLPIKPSGIKSLNEAVFATGFPSGMDYTGDNISKFIRQVQRAKKIRMLGSAALMAAFVSCGRADAYFEQNIRLWDVAAAGAIVKAAGGVIDIKKNPEGFKCDFGAFSTASLMEDFYGS